MSLEENKRIVRRYYEEIWNKNSLECLDEIVADDYIEQPGGSGIEGWKQWFNLMHSAFPDVHYTVEDITAEGDKVAARFSVRGTHKGEFMGIPPTNKQINITVLTMKKIVNGKIQEAWTKIDRLGLMEQLGAVPPKG